MKYAVLALAMFFLCACAEASYQTQARTAANITAFAIEEIDGIIHLAMQPDKRRCQREALGDSSRFTYCMRKWVRLVAAKNVAWDANEAFIRSLDTVNRQQEGNPGGVITCGLSTVGSLLRALEEAGLDIRRPGVAAWIQYTEMMGTMCSMARPGGTLGSGSSEVD